MDNTIIQQGRFTADGNAKTLQIRSDVDWMRVYNKTVAAASQTTAVGVEYYWQRGFGADEGWEYKKSNAANAANLSTYLTSGGFTLVDTSADPVGNPVALTSITNANPPVVATGSTAGLVAGDVVRLFNVAGAQQLGGYDFTIGSVVANTSFTLPYMTDQLTVAGTTGVYRKIKWNPLFYPRRRAITKATSSGSSTIVTMSVTHNLTVGQQVRFVVPAGFGGSWANLNGQQAEISAINTSNNTITVGIDSSTYGTWAFPLTGDVPFSPAWVVPIGQGTDASIADPNLLDGATINQGYIGMILAAGANSPAGSTSDVIYWVAGKSFSVENS